jgi:hypothetical protein
MVPDISGNNQQDYQTVEPLANLTLNYPLDPELVEQLQRTVIPALPSSSLRVA